MPFSKLESKALAHSSFVWHPSSSAKGTKFSGISLSAKASWKEKIATASREASQKNFLKLSIFIILLGSSYLANGLRASLALSKGLALIPSSGLLTWNGLAVLAASSDAFLADSPCWALMSAVAA